MSEQTVLEEAAEAVFGPRQDDYGSPSENFTLIAALWSVVIEYRLAADPNYKVAPTDVAILNILQKVARELHRPKRDNRVDIAGYAATLEMVAERDTAPDDAIPASYPDIVDGDGDTWEFQQVRRGVPQYKMRHGGDGHCSEETILRLFPPREIVDSHGFRWVHKGEGLYTMLYLSGAEASERWLTCQAPESIYERYGRPAA